ncbi:hypothetical protein [Ensifer aridi]|uniref:hypothetical protein n=1 Tax=Ensifer aridi TaxID=1708715 RepID=UPI0004198323|nr:hypothetical protein [Ensifer aridi]
MRRIDIWFLLLAIICLVIGVSLGIWMGLSHDFQFAPVHAHLNLLGWTSLALFGLVYRVYPELGASPLARVHFALAAVGVLAFPVGIALSLADVTIVVAVVGAFVWLAAVATFLIQIILLAFRGTANPMTFAAPAE